MIATTWAIPFPFVIFKLMVYPPNSKNFVALKPVFFATECSLAALPTVFLFVLHIRILLTAWKLSREMKVPFKQVRFNLPANSLK